MFYILVEIWFVWIKKAFLIDEFDITCGGVYFYTLIYVCLQYINEANNIWLINLKFILPGNDERMIKNRQKCIFIMILSC